MEKIDYVKLNKYDLEILKLIALFGKTFDVVLGKTFFTSVQIARNNLTRMQKRGLIKFVESGHLSPRKAIILGYWGRKVMRDLEIKIQPYKQTRTLKHNILEQITFHHLSKIGEVEKKSVWHHKNTYFAVPDFIFRPGGNRIIFVEVETTQKSSNRYKDFVSRVSKDEPSAVLYIVEKKAFTKTLAKIMPTWDKLLYLGIDEMIENIEKTNRAGARTQKHILEEEV